jgi:hypothetical protein
MELQYFGKVLEEALHDEIIYCYTIQDIRYNKGVAVSALLENTRFENTKSFKRYLSD